MYGKVTQISQQDHPAVFFASHQLFSLQAQVEYRYSVDSDALYHPSPFVLRVSSVQVPQQPLRRTATWRCRDEHCGYEPEVSYRTINMNELQGTSQITSILSSYLTSTAIINLLISVLQRRQHAVHWASESFIVGVINSLVLRNPCIEETGPMLGQRTL